jgi:hypothetical protein
MNNFQLTSFDPNNNFLYNIIFPIPIITSRSIESQNHNLELKLSDSRFNSDSKKLILEYIVSSTQKDLSGVKIQADNQLAGFETTYRRKTPQDIQAELERTVANNPNVILSDNEYRSLSLTQKELGWISNYNQYDSSTTYRRKTPQDIQAELERTVEWRIANNPNVILSDNEYKSLSLAQKELGWISNYNQYDSSTTYRRKTPQDIQAELKRTVEWRIANNPNVILSDNEYRSLSLAQKELGWISSYNQYDSTTSWRRKTTQDIKRDINNHHNRNIESQMNNILSRGTPHQITRFPVVLPELAIRDDNYTYIQLTQALYNEYKRLESQLLK